MKNAIDLFAGAGGLTIALQETGFNVVFANEINHKFAETHHYNFPSIPLIEKDIKDIDVDQISSILQGQKVNLVAGGPPCQGFSIFGKRRFINTLGYNPRQDPRNFLVYEFIRIVNLLQPEFFFMENVKGFTNLDNGLFIKEVEKEFRQNVYPKLKQEVSLDVRRDLISEIEGLSDDSLQESLFGVLNDMSLVDIYRELPKSIKQSFVKLLKSTVLS